MPRIVFVEPTGTRREIDAPIGVTLMVAWRAITDSTEICECTG